MATASESAEHLLGVLGKGVKSVTVGKDNVTTTFQDGEDLRETVGFFERRAATASGTSTRARSVRLHVASGLE